MSLAPASLSESSDPSPSELHAEPRVSQSPPQIPLPEALKSISSTDLSAQLSSNPALSTFPGTTPDTLLVVDATPSDRCHVPTSPLGAHPSDPEPSLIPPLVISAVDSGTASDLGVLDTMADSTTQEPATSNGSHITIASPIKSAPSNDHFANPYMLPIPVLPLNPAMPYTFSDIIDNGASPDAIPPEIAAADISIAADRTYVETSSGPAAHLLKRRLDQQFGVGPSVRTPYTITGFTNQHGKEMYRISHREMPAPAAPGMDAEDRLVQSKASISSDASSPKQSRRSRMSLLPQFHKSSTSSRPHTTSGPTKKLRKTRSIPDLVSTAVGSVQAAGPTVPYPGRTHSHSVTSGDVSRFSAVSARYATPTKTGDIFGDLMEWSVPASATTSSSFSAQSVEYGKSRSAINPFGVGVTFESPAPLPPPEFLPLSIRTLREVQSFESGLTMKQGDLMGRPGRDSPATPDAIVEEGGVDRPSSGEPLVPPSVNLIPPSEGDGSTASEVPDGNSEQDQSVSESGYGPSPETAVYAHYSTDVFDVLQTFKGLPLPDKLSPESTGATVKMSFSADETAAPRNDPRFVIWGEIQPEWDKDDISASRESFGVSSTPASSTKRRGSKVAKGKTPEPPAVQVSSTSDKILVAATIERWIAQLTSDLNYDELLDFFLTYRTYVTAIDLCHFLICRLHWALQQPSSPSQEKTRRIVRVRTFVAIRYWLLTFFTVDFLPSRELRLLLADWLNTLIRDPILQRLPDARDIVKRLIKVAKECKQMHSGAAADSRPKNDNSKSSLGRKEQLLGEMFAEATKRASAEDDDTELDLDFVPIQGSDPETYRFSQDPANSHLGGAHVGSGLTSGRPASLPLTSFNILQRTDHAPGPTVEGETPIMQPPVVLPSHNNAISRAFVKTIGRLGRWTRVLNSRSVTRSSLTACADVSAFDLEQVSTRDFLTYGGVEQYLKMSQPTKSLPTGIGLQTVLPMAPSSFTPSRPPPPSSFNRPSSQQISPPSTISRSTHLDCSSESPTTPTQALHSAETNASVVSPEAPLLNHPPSYAESVNESVDVPPSVTGSTDLQDSSSIHSNTQSLLQPDGSPGRAQSFRSNSTDSFGSPLAEGVMPTFARPLQNHWQFDVVSIDDLDLSDTSSDIHGIPNAPPGLRRPPRKLPMRRDFEFVRQSKVSSMGIISHESMVSESSSSASFNGIGGSIQQWQMNALVDSLSDDEETGDVEAALRRLEGQINPEKQQEKVLKVDGWVRAIQERLAKGDYEDEEPRFPMDDSDEENSNDDYGEQQNESGIDVSQTSTETHDDPVDDTNNDTQDVTETAITPVPTQVSHNISPPGLDAPPRSANVKPEPEPAIPSEILESRMPPEPPVVTPSGPMVVSKFVTSSSIPQIHRSFILNYRAQALAELFSMIDRELFMGIKFEELVLDDWMGCEEVDVLDWVQYLKDRATWKALRRYPNKTSALGSEWVTRAMRRIGWNRIGMFESRVFRDLKKFTSNVDDFKFMRDAVESIVDAKPLEASSHAASIASGGGTDPSTRARTGSDARPNVPTACIPFIGIYLSQLHRLSKLPDLIDPTSPNESVGIDPVTSNFEPLAHPEVFSALAPLPSSMHLEPLINVHKQRMIAGVIKSLVAGQHLASRVQFSEVDKRLFQKCLRLRGLDAETLQRALAMYSD
ncbi:hypothetical protein BDQ17DRAFT_1427575 [Cyathus striatus]|nr:hypothetical protein BDQ17DRAFT_1427575 [Cyathus striatus]